MKALTVEWVLEDDMLSPEYCDEPGIAPVVRLPEADEVIEQAVMLAEWIVRLTDGESDENQDARAFLTSPLVAAWRERQEGK